MVSQIVGAQKDARADSPMLRDDEEDDKDAQEQLWGLDDDDEQVALDFDDVLHDEAWDFDLDADEHMLLDDDSPATLSTLDSDSPTLAPDSPTLDFDDPTLDSDSGFVDEDAEMPFELAWDDADSLAHDRKATSVCSDDAISVASFDYEGRFFALGSAAAPGTVCTADAAGTHPQISDGAEIVTHHELFDFDFDRDLPDADAHETAARLDDDPRSHAEAHNALLFEPDQVSTGVASAGACDHPQESELLWSRG